MNAISRCDLVSVRQFSPTRAFFWNGISETSSREAYEAQEPSGISAAVHNRPNPASSCATGLTTACFRWLQRIVAARDRGHSNNGSVNMINNRLATVFGVLVVLAALAVSAKAAEVVHEVPAVASPGNAPEAKAILGAKLLVCNTCHGADGVPRSAAAPVIWGQQEAFLLKQMHDFQSGDRASEVMSWMATALTQSEQAAAAAYFAKKNWPARVSRAAAASPPALVAVCQVCHQQNFVGGPQAPRLAGQSYEYLVETMRRYAEGERKNNADMMNIMQAISPTEREAIARYISGP
jgi:cytochrome c553